MADYKAKLKELFLETARENASDLHIGVGRKPTLRMDGVLAPIQKEAVLTPEMAEGLVMELLSPEQREQLEKLAENP